MSSAKVRGTFFARGIDLLKHSIQEENYFERKYVENNQRILTESHNLFQVELIIILKCCPI